MYLVLLSETKYVTKICFFKKLESYKSYVSEEPKEGFPVMLFLGSEANAYMY